MDIPGYTILRELGRGGMATVYLARQDRLGRQVALKVMEPVPGLGDDFTARFIKEGRIIARLQHPQIVTIFDLDSAGELHYFSMEFLPNGTLAEKIVAGLSETSTIDIIRRVAQALSIAHDNGVIHRDIKPQNILFRTDGTPVLTDFGIARAASSGPEATALTNVGMIVGSPRYMSPEQSMSRPVDARSDLYSLGCVFFEMLTQDLPYQAEDVISLAMQHCSAPLPELPTRLARYQPIIDRLLAKEPEQRFGSTQALVQALEQVEQGQDLSAALDEDEATAVATQVLTQTPRSPPTPEMAATGTGPLPQPPQELSNPQQPPTKRPRNLAIAALALLVVGIASYFGVLQRPAPDPLLKVMRQLPQPAPDRSPTIERYENLALEHLRAGEFDRSTELIQLALATEPDDARLQAIETLIEDHRAASNQLSKAHALLTQGKIAESLSVIEDGLKRVPQHPDLTDLRSKALTAQAHANRTMADTRRKEAQQALKAGQLAEALRLIREGLAAVADDPELTALQSQVQTALKTDRNVREILSNATNLIAEGLLQDSLDLIDQGLELAPENRQLSDLRATVKHQMQREQGRQANKLHQQAESELQEGALDQALATIERALILQPEDKSLTETRQSILDAQQDSRVQSLLDQARAALSDGESKRALKLVDSALGLRQDDPRSLALRERIQVHLAAEQLIEKTKSEVKRLQENGRIGAALEQVENTLQQFPEDATLESLRQQLRDQQLAQNQDAARALSARASQLLAEGDSQQAQVLIDHGRAIDAENPDLIELEQRIARQRSTANERQRAMAECMQLNPTRAAPAVKLNAMTAAVDCLLSIPNITEKPAQLNGPLEQIRNDLTAWANQQQTAELSMRALDLLERLETVRHQDSKLHELRRRLAAQAGLIPDMRDIEGGCFVIGSSNDSAPREPDEAQREVCIDDFALASTETKQHDFALFIEKADYRTDAERGAGGADGCLTLDRQAAEQPWSYHSWANWHKPNKYQESRDDHPVTCVSANDARAYLTWLSEITGVPYRLPTEAEWEYAARAATRTPTFWGRADSAACTYANVADKGHDWTNSFDCNDGFEWIAPTKSFPPNPWGLHDMLGNVSEWTCSEYRELYDGNETECAPEGGRAPLVMRGGAWNSAPANLRSAYRNRNFPESRYSFVGFRVARDGNAAAKVGDSAAARVIPQRESSQTAAQQQNP
ncbi:MULTISPECIES: SUMF1/EgtB/PvdO family nonheme iron enzyme [Thiorhodovibrio]|uniref:SUMF1/EgtB/PvdO family nonheme iron enzyme n=1 Tax=Thiorhodovibrio TaxID=61593 RepID=UPI0019125868|nr:MULTISPECIES: SUMF1/EgtB/PvdO family nonheme iron enzyme [Thiorhodovibrio]MBK5970448.1 hypothetical protein [Thiorhodovibrio winogradskyi]WPL11428.1 Serine/threonine-protein kinase PrkC [Thiorhodovibrio litoralis]